MKRVLDNNPDIRRDSLDHRVGTLDHRVVELDHPSVNSGTTTRFSRFPSDSTKGRIVSRDRPSLTQLSQQLLLDLYDVF